MSVPGIPRTRSRLHAQFSARRVAASARAGMAIAAIMLLLEDSAIHPYPTEAAIGMGLVLTSALIQAFTSRPRVIQAEELIAAVGGLLVMGLGNGQVTAVTLLWLAAVATGAGLRGRVSVVGSVLFITAMVLPVIRFGELSAEYAALFVVAASLLLSGRAVLSEKQHFLDLARYEADHDGLTGALSRSAFHQALEQAIADAAVTHAQFSLVTLDLDGFGRINKRYGHAAGDAMLVRVAEQIAKLAGDDALLGRIGGDEFAAVLPLADAPDFSTRLIEAIATGDVSEQGIGCSIGIAQAPSDGENASALLRASDIALRVAKASGHGHVVTYAGESLSASGDAGAEALLDRLIEGDGIEMFVQPVVDLSTREVHAYEALARFQLGSTNSPLHWFAVADEFNRREELEQACLAAAVELFDTLPARASLSVNVSGTVLPSRATMAILGRVPDPTRLIVEITEDALIREDDVALSSAIATLRARGVKFAVDDMGAGYAGLRQIAALHPDYLKLDRSIISNIHLDSDRCALVRAMAGYADRVGVQLVAEGVEIPEELAAITSLGVNYVQGYLFARPGTPWPSLSPATEVGAPGQARRVA